MKFDFNCRYLQRKYERLHSSMCWYSQPKIHRISILCFKICPSILLSSLHYFSYGTHSIIIYQTLSTTTAKRYLKIDHDNTPCINPVYRRDRNSFLTLPEDAISRHNADKSNIIIEVGLYHLCELSDIIWNWRWDLAKIRANTGVEIKHDDVY